VASIHSFTQASVIALVFLGSIGIPKHIVCLNVKRVKILQGTPEKGHGES
jgi:hypothetical protein